MLFHYLRVLNNIKFAFHIFHSDVYKRQEERTWAAEHVVGVAQGSREDIMADLRANFEGECSEVGMYLAMARVAHREGYPEVGLYYEKAAYEEAEHCLLYTSLPINRQSHIAKQPS